jgi:hypothetical protein
MKRIVRQLATETNSVPAKAADHLDEVLHKVLVRVRAGKPARLPGLGRFLPGPELQFQFEQPNETKTAKKHNVNRQAAERKAGRSRS